MITGNRKTEIPAPPKKKPSASLFTTNGPFTVRSQNRSVWAMA